LLGGKYPSTTIFSAAANFAAAASAAVVSFCCYSLSLYYLRLS